VLHVSFACKVFLDHPQKKVWVSWRGSQLSPVRVSKNKKSKKGIESVEQCATQGFNLVKQGKLSIEEQSCI
jgi:hypothetical protein